MGAACVLLLAGWHYQAKGDTRTRYFLRGDCLPDNRCPGHALPRFGNQPINAEGMVHDEEAVRVNHCLYGRKARIVRPVGHKRHDSRTK